MAVIIVVGNDCSLQGVLKELTEAEGELVLLNSGIEELKKEIEKGNGFKEGFALAENLLDKINKQIRFINKNSQFIPRGTEINIPLVTMPHKRNPFLRSVKRIKIPE